MKKFQIAILTVLSVLFVLIITTCKRTVALGSAVDILPPRSAFEPPIAGDSKNSARGNLKFKGSASDDSGVAAVTVVLKSIKPGVNFTNSYPATLSSPGAYETDWHLEIKNEWSGTYRDERELIKKYPIPDGTYQVSIIVTDKQGRTSEPNRSQITIDNTPPVFLLSNFTKSALRAHDKLDDPDGVKQPFGSQIIVKGDLADASEIKTIKLITYNASDKTKFVEHEPIQLGGAKIADNIIASTNANEIDDIATAGDSGLKPDQYLATWDLQGRGSKTSNIIPDFFISDSATVIGDVSQEGNKTEYYFLADEIKAEMLKKNYTIQTIYDYISGVEPWDPDPAIQASAMLDKLCNDDGFLNKLKEARIFNYTEEERTNSDPFISIGKSKLVFQLDPCARPSYYVANCPPSDGSSEFPQFMDQSWVTIQINRNKDGIPVLSDISTDEKIKQSVKDSKLTLWIVEKVSSVSKTAFIDALKNKTNFIADGTYFEKVGKLFTPDNLDMDKFTFSISGETTVEVKFKLSEVKTDTNWTAVAGSEYAFVLTGCDENAHELSVQNSGGELIDRFACVKVTASGNPPLVRITDRTADRQWFKADDKLKLTFKLSGGMPSKPLTVKCDATEIAYKEVSGEYKLGDDGTGIPLSTLAEGTHTITITTGNSIGDTEDSIEFYLDKTKPVIEISKPIAVGANGQTTTTFDSWSPTFTLKVDEGKDPTTLSSMSPRKSLKFQISYDNGTTFEAKEYNASLINGNDEYEAIVNVTKPSFAVKFIAEDMAGNTTELQTTSFTVSTDKPQIETVKATVQKSGDFVDITGNTGNIGTYISKKLVEHGGFDIRVIAKKYIQAPGTNTLDEDAHIKVNKVEFIIGGTTKATIDPYDCNDNTKNTIHSDKLDLTSLTMADGVPVTIRATAEDGKKQETTLTFRVDSTPPELKITSPVADGQAITADTKIAGYAADSESGIKEASKQYTYKIVNTADNSPVSGASGSLKWDNQTNPTEWTIPNPFTSSTQAEGEFKIVIENIKDDAGNALSEVEKKVTIDKNPPALTVASYANEINANALTNGDTSAQIYKNSDFWLAGMASDSNALDDTDAVVISGLGTVPIKIEKGAIGPDKKWKHKVTGLSEDEHTVTITAKDVAGKVTNKQVTVVYDKTPPTIDRNALTLKQNNAIVEPATGWFGVGTLEINGSAKDKNGVTKVQYSLDGGGSWRDFAGTNSFNGIIQIATDTTQIQVRAVDRAGNESEPKKITIKVDSTKPTVKVEKINGEAYAPGEPKLIKNSPLSITVSNTDVGSGFDHYEYKVGADEYQTLTVTAGVGSITIPSDTTVKIRAVDKVGLYSDEWQIPVQLDDMRPTVAFNRDVVNGTVNKTITISGTATDNRGLAKVELTINGIKAGETTATNVTKTYTKTGAYNWSETLDTTTYKDNTDITLTVVATDEAGNVSTSDTRVLTIDQDSDRPEIVVQGPTALTNGTLNSNSVTGSITDDDDVKELYISQNGTDWGAPVTLTNGINWSYNGLADGDRTLYFKVVDVAGTTFMSSTTADQLTLPKTYLSDKTSMPIGAPATFMVDTKKPDIMEVKTTVDSKTAVLMQNALFKVDSIKLTVVAKDTNGIQSVVAKLAGQSDVTLTGEAGNTANSNETFTGELALGDHGVKELEIEVTDKAGAKQTQSYILRVDKQGPKPLILYPKNSDAVAGTISISGSISDDSKVSSGVDKDETKYFFANNNDIPTESSAWKNMKTSTVANFSFDYSFPNYVYNEGDLTTHDDDVLTIDGTAVPIDWKVPNTDRYKLPLWIRSKDMAGNVSIDKFTILYNAVAEKPVLTIVSPTSEAKVGGTFTIFGTAKVDIGTLSDVEEGYIQFSKSATFDSNNCNINGVDFWEGGNGVSLTSISNGSWNYIANADSKLDPKGADKSWNLYVRVRGKNTRKNRLGDWTDPIQITVDKDTPTINSAKVQKGADPAQNYTSNMWVSDGCVLTADLQDASGLKEIKVMFGYYKNKEEVNGNGNNEFIFKKGETTPTWLMENGTVATGGKNYKLQLPMDLTKLVPDAQTNQTFKVNVFIQEDTNQNLNNSMEFTFRYDKLPPNGAFGEKIESGNASFDTGSVTNTRLAEAVGNFTGTSTKLILVDNVIVTPKSRTGDTVTFNETITGGTHNYIVYEPKAIIKGSFQAHGVANDDGSGVKSVKVVVQDRNGGTSAEVESTSSGANRFTREYGNQVVWNADIDVSGLADGQGKVICTITDDAGNTKTSETLVFISNKPITPTKLTFGTDLDASGTVDSNEVEKEQMSITRDGTVSKQEKFYRGSVDFGTWTFKNVKSNFAVEFIGGNADLKYTLSVDNTGTLTALPNHENKTISSNGEISLNDADFTAIGDGTGKKLVLTLTDDSGWKATVNITVNVQIADTDAPKSAILPFYWNSKTDNSVVHMDVNRNTSINLGHIEFDGYDTGSGTYTNKPAVSGTVIVKGTAYDEKLLNSLTFNFAGLTATVNYPNDSSSPWTVTSGASAGLTVKVESKRLDQSGHYIVWEVMFESEKIDSVVKADTTLSVVANDKGSNKSSSQGSTSSIISGTGTRKTNIKLQLQDGTDFSQIKPGMRVRMYNPNQTRQAYYASIASVDPDAKTIDVDSAVDDAEVKAYDIYKNDHNSYTMNVSIVPYISQVITPTSEEGDANNLTRYGRTAQGDYTVLKDANNQTEKIKVIGFNLTGAKYGGTAINTVDVVRNITVARQSDSYAQNFITGGTYTQKALQFVPTNGDLELTVGGLKTINNSNKTDGDGFSGDVALWNNEGDNYAHKNVGDNRTIVVLSANELVKRTMITAPSFAVLNNKLGYAYSRITEFFMTQKANNRVERFGQNPGSYLGTAFAYDQWGNTFGISGNNDVAMGGDGKIYQVSSYYLHWNAPGSVAGSQNLFGLGGYHYRSQANRIMALTPVPNIDTSDALTQMRRARMQQPVLQTHGEYVYLAYYDMATQKLELRVDKPTRNGGLVAVNGLGSAGFTTFAGSLTERNKSDSKGATGGQTAGAMVFATTAGGGLATGLTITDAYVVVAYKTANGLELAYAPIADVEVPSKNQSVDKFTKITVDADSSTGAYVRATSSGNVVHLAYYDSTSGGRLKYAKIDLGSTDKTPQVAVVDNVEGNTGYYTSITVNAAGKPFIAYAMKDYVDSASKMALKLAYPIDIGDVKNGSDETEQCYTGDWEIMNLRASYGLQGSNYDCPPQITAFYYNNDICVGYATMENLEYVKVPVKH